jgi:hypothetical protein
MAMHCRESRFQGCLAISSMEIVSQSQLQLGYQPDVIRLSSAHSYGPVASVPEMEISIL